MDCINVNSLVVVLYYTYVSYYCDRRLDEGYMGSRYYFLQWQVNLQYLKIKSLKNLLNSGSRLGISALI